MKILLFIIISCITFTTANAQKAIVNYKVSSENIFDSTRPDTLPDAIQRTFKEAEKNFEMISYKLKINDEEATFQMEDKMLNDGNRKARITVALAGLSSRFYSNKKTNVSLEQSDVYGQQFLISSSFDRLQWDTTRESKMIGEFKVFKAIALETYDTGNSKETWEVVAWFAPEISHPFGPGGYGGLPGLILQLHRAGKIYTASNYKEVKGELLIEKPLEGKKITQDKFENIGREIKFN